MGLPACVKEKYFSPDRIKVLKPTGTCTYKLHSTVQYLKSFCMNKGVVFFEPILHSFQG